MGFQNSFVAQTAAAANPSNVQQSNYGSAINTALAGSTDQSAANGVNAQQSSLANALQAQANGGGAANQLSGQALQAATNTATQQAAGAAASQKGLSPAAAARLAMQNQASQSQTAAGQQAANVGNNSLNAQSQLGTQLNNQMNTDIAQQNANTSALGTAGGLQNSQNANNITDVGNANSINAGISSQNQASTNSLISGVGNATAGALTSAMSALYRGGEVKRYATGGPVLMDTTLPPAPTYSGAVAPGSSSLPNQITASRVTAPTAPSSNPNQNYFNLGSALASNLMKPSAPSSGLAMPSMGSQYAGSSPSLFGGSSNGSSGGSGGISPALGSQLAGDGSGILGGASSAGTAGAAAGGAADAAGALGAADAGAGAAAGGAAAAGGGAADLLPLLLLANGGQATNFIGGGHVPGKAKVAGNSLKNDVVPAMLSPKEIVLPRTVTMSPDAPEKAKRFVEAIQAKNKKEERNSSVPASQGYAKLLAKHREVSQKMAELDQMLKGGK